MWFGGWGGRPIEEAAAAELLRIEGAEGVYPETEMAEKRYPGRHYARLVDKNVDGDGEVQDAKTQYLYG